MVVGITTYNYAPEIYPSRAVNQGVIHVVDHCDTLTIRYASQPPRRRSSVRHHLRVARVGDALDTQVIIRLNDR